jgi:hypothetical protein
MKLENINRLDESLELGRQYLIIEGLLADLVATSVSKIQTYIAARDKVVQQLGLKNYVDAARDLEVSLLDNSSEADKWWQAAAAAVDKKHGGKSTPKERAAIIAKIKAKVEPIINRDMENTEDRLATYYAKKTGQDSRRVERLFDILFGDSAPKPKRQRRSRRDYAYSEDIWDKVSSGLDMLDPKKRVLRGAQMIRANNNARVATVAISILSQQFDKINVGRKLNDIGKKPPPIPLTQKYEMAMFINKCMLDASKHANKDKDPGYWVHKIRNKAKRMGMKITINQLPTQPYPKDFEEFKRQYGKPVLKPGQKVQP